MHAVILTFPGHFFQTCLCVKRLIEHYPEIHKIHFVLDDVQASPWHSYSIDFAAAIFSLTDVPCEILCVSTLPKIRDCVAGWWRQQLIKLTLDQILPGDAWFVVDGDVIFLSRCEIKDRIPISRRYDETSRWSQMCVNYVKGVLGTDQGIMHDENQAVITSPVPFRYLDRDILQALRSHVESRFGADFVSLHLGWFHDQTIVADIDPPVRWVMSEWELIECFRQIVQNQKLPYHDIGSGYQIDAEIGRPGRDVFVHSYLRDSSISPLWFAQQGVAVDDHVWNKSLAWYDARERQKLT